jgi:hypothetical protein
MVEHKRDGLTHGSARALVVSLELAPHSNVEALADQNLKTPWRELVADPDFTAICICNHGSGRSKNLANEIAKRTGKKAFFVGLLAFADIVPPTRDQEEETKKHLLMKELAKAPCVILLVEGDDDYDHQFCEELYKEVLQQGHTFIHIPFSRLDEIIEMISKLKFPKTLIE